MWWKLSTRPDAMHDGHLHQPWAGGHELYRVRARRRVASVRAAWSLGLHCPMLTPSRHERRRERRRRHFQRFPLYMQLVGRPPPRRQHDNTQWSSSSSSSLQRHYRAPVTVKYFPLDFCAVLYNVIEGIRAWRVLHFTCIPHTHTKDKVVAN